MRRCPNCRHIEDREAEFCPNCGGPLVVESPLQKAGEVREQPANNLLVAGAVLSVVLAVSAYVRTS